MKKMSKEKKQSTYGGIAWWNIGILVSLLISSIVSLVQGGVMVAQAATPVDVNGDASSRRGYSPSYINSNMFVRLHKYPSKTTVSIGV